MTIIIVISINNNKIIIITIKKQFEIEYKSIYKYILIS